VRQSAPLFKLGVITATAAVSESLSHEKILGLVRQHVTGDFGCICNEDIDSNHAAIKHGDRVLSSYMVNGEKLYVITEHDRSVTTVLFADEY
jgi:hypothetical protein